MGGGKEEATGGTRDKKKVDPRKKKNLGRQSRPCDREGHSNGSGRSSASTNAATTGSAMATGDKTTPFSTHLVTIFSSDSM